jgi:uroporphyrinogen-III decarboxylase
MDAAVWFAGVQQAVLLAMDDPASFGRLMRVIAEADYARSELAAGHPRVDIVVQRGWYSSTDFWSPALFDAFVTPHLRELGAMVHRRGKKLAYVMTTGIETLGERLADAGVDLLYFVDPIDPVQKEVSLERIRQRLGGRLTLAGGISSLTLASGDSARVEEGVRRAVETFSPTRRFILQPVDALFPDTPWTGVASMIDAWKRCR